MENKADEDDKTYASELILGRHNKLNLKFDWRIFVCGWGSAFINIAVTYPIYKMIFRQMLQGISLVPAFSQIKSEGFTYLYRGVFPPLAQKTISLSLMFGFYDAIKRKLINDFNTQEYVAKVLAGIASGTVESVMLPLERVQTILVDSKYHSSFKNTPQAFRIIWNSYGTKELYRGLVPVLYRNGPSNAMFFILKEEADTRLPKMALPLTKPVIEFLSGAVIGASISTIFYPFNVLKVAMQSDLGHRHESMWSCTKRIYHSRDNKISLFYRGCTFNAYRSFLSWGIVNTAYEHLKKVIY